MSDELKPCPFCGGMAEIVEIDEGENAGGSCVCCTKCLASSNVEFGFKENFFSNWNRRVQTPVSDAVARLVEENKALREALTEIEGSSSTTGWVPPRPRRSWPRGGAR